MRVYEAHVLNKSRGWQGSPMSLPANTPGDVEFYTTVGDKQVDELAALTFGGVQVPL